jgi:hypothetical protein
MSPRVAGHDTLEATLHHGMVLMVASLRTVSHVRENLGNASASPEASSAPNETQAALAEGTHRRRRSRLARVQGCESESRRARGVPGRLAVFRECGIIGSGRAAGPSHKASWHRKYCPSRPAPGFAPMRTGHGGAILRSPLGAPPVHGHDPVALLPPCPRAPRRPPHAGSWPPSRSFSCGCPTCFHPTTSSTAMRRSSA